MAISVKPVLISEKQMEAIKKIQEEQRKKSEGRSCANDPRNCSGING
ncbi:hypothetical protein [Salmonella enterica]